MSELASPETPVYVVPEKNLIPVSDHLGQMATVPASRMFLIKKNLKVFQEKAPDMPIYDASQGDGGASLPGVPPEILQRAFELQLEHGTSYDQPFGTRAFQESVVEQYLKLDPKYGFGPGNVAATVGGRDALTKAYQAMVNLGHGRQGDVLIVSRVPWISYNWGPYQIGANVMLAPGDPADGWKYTPEGIKACVELAAQSGRKIAGIVITCPDNPTGRILSMEEQAMLGRTALESGVAFVLYDWIYHYITDQAPMDINAFLELFPPEFRSRLIFLDGLTKSMGASNVRSAHLLASEEVIKFTVARASHSVIPPFYGQAVAMAAYEIGFENACRTIAEPTNASRGVLRKFFDEKSFNYIIGQGYYAFIDVGKWLREKGWADSEELGQYLAAEHGVAIVPGVFFSKYGGDWLRFSYATPPERTQGAAERLLAGLTALVS